eukprot:SAG31_NODE_8824_length_1381_cov_1.780811_2_plen_320_part_00
MNELTIMDAMEGAEPKAALIQLLMDPVWMAAVQKLAADHDAAAKAAERARVETEQKANAARLVAQEKLIEAAKFAEAMALRSLYYEITVERTGEFVVGWATRGVQLCQLAGDKSIIHEDVGTGTLAIKVCSNVGFDSRWVEGDVISTAMWRQQPGVLEAEFWRNGNTMAVARHTDGTAFENGLAADAFPELFPVISVQQNGICNVNFGRYRDFYHCPPCLQILPWPRIPAFDGHTVGGYRPQTPPIEQPNLAADTKQPSKKNKKHKRNKKTATTTTKTTATKSKLTSPSNDRRTGPSSTASVRSPQKRKKSSKGKFKSS